MVQFTVAKVAGWNGLFIGIEIWGILYSVIGFLDGWVWLGIC
jgi:hypothetical protein